MSLCCLQNFHSSEEFSKALAAMQAAFDVHPKFYTLEGQRLFETTEMFWSRKIYLGGTRVVGGWILLLHW